MPKAAYFVPVLFLAQAGLVYLASGAEQRPPIPDLSQFPAQFGAWRMLGEEPIASDVRGQLQADQLVSRNYLLTPGGASANLLVAWFQTQSQGTRQPHSPQVCLPGAGWTPIVADQVQAHAGDQRVSINRYVAALGGQLAVVLYWYQTPNRIVAGEWASKFWTVWDAVSHRRTDIALVRVVTWPHSSNYEEATREGLAFAQQLYPALHVALPH